MVTRQSMDLYLQYHQSMKRSVVNILLPKRRERFTTTTITIFILSLFILFFVSCLILGRAHILEQWWPNHSTARGMHCRHSCGRYSGPFHRQNVLKISVAWTEFSHRILAKLNTRFMLSDWLKSASFDMCVTHGARSADAIVSSATWGSNRRWWRIWYKIKTVLVQNVQL